MTRRGLWKLSVLTDAIEPGDIVPEAFATV
jgi:hypothetical protein